MKYDPNIHHRRSIRLKRYDYSSPGAYFVTTVTRKRECLFGEVVEGSMHLSKMGGIVQQVWLDLPNHFSHVVLDAFCIMPNHIHGIIILTDTLGRGGSELQWPSVTDQIRKKTKIESNAPRTHPYTRHGIPEIVRVVKSFSARRINRFRGISGVPVWQRNYYERIIRNENELNAIRRYILYNPLQWELDGENPANTQI
jgi:REP element-mobilizing transposase RayT